MIFFSKIKRFTPSPSRGYILIQTIVFGTVAVIIISGLVNWAVVNMKVSKRAVFREQALQIAEAGIDYYRWHLAHAAQDFKDGTNVAGPYIHNFYDKDGDLAGTYSLTITPPTTGSTLVKVQSQGKVIGDASVKRTILTQLAIPSLAKYAFVSDSDMRFGVGTEVFGPIHSNGGIRFDGLAHNIVSSAGSTYTDGDSDACTGNSWAVHTCTGTDDPSPPTALPARPDVFEAGRQLSVPAVDFTGFTSDLAQIRDNAIASGKHFSGSGALGYDIVLNTNNTFTVYKVNSLTSPPSGCTNTASQTGWGTWTINNETLITGTNTFTIPANGLIFVEDNVWVRGQINGSRVTIASGKFPDTAGARTSITVNNNLKYTSYTGSDVISLIAQQDINTGLQSDNDLRIDAALIAQNGRVGRYYYNTSCHGSGSSNNWYGRNSITLYGMIGTDLRYGFAYTGSNNFDCGGTIGQIAGGYCTRNITYDANLLYGPPPSFPLTSDQYSIVSWEEVEI